MSSILIAFEWFLCRCVKLRDKYKYSRDAVCLCLSRTPAMIGCSFVVDREYFGEIGLLDPGMEVYGGENIELGMRVRLIIKNALKLEGDFDK